MSDCPNIEVVIGGVTVPCLLDTGSMASAVTEAFLEPIGHPSTVPGVLEMIVTSRCYEELFEALVPSLFNCFVVSCAPDPVYQALQQCHQSAVQISRTYNSTACVHGKGAVCIPGGMMNFVPSTCLEQLVGPTALFEPPVVGLPAGLLASLSLVQVSRGVAYIPHG